MNKLAEEARRLALKDYEDLYDIDEHGTVFNRKQDRPIYVDRTNQHGYHRVNLLGPNGRSRHFVHRLAAKTFHPDKYTADLVIDHLDGDKTNTHYTNLEPITQSDNTLRAIALGLRSYGKK